MVTFWEGEVIDNKNASFMTSKWGASLSSDLRHWSKFPAFSSLQNEVKSRHGRCAGLCCGLKLEEALMLPCASPCMALSQSTHLGTGRSWVANNRL